MNLDTGKPIRWVRWADIPESVEQQGEFEAFRCNPEEWQGKGLPLSEIIYRGKCRMRFVPAAPKIGSKPTTPRELFDSLDDARKRLVVFVEPPPILIPGLVQIHECEVRACHKPAYFQVSDEQEIEPQVDENGREYERAIMLMPHWFCARHFRLPTIVSRRGVQSEVKIEEGEPGRPK